MTMLDFREHTSKRRFLEMEPLHIDATDFSERLGFEGNEETPAVRLLETPPRKRYSPTASMFIGRRGRGKSYMLSSMGDLLKQRAMQSHVDYGLFANYSLLVADVADPHMVDRLLEFPEWAKNAFCAVDEVQSAFPGRRSIATVNVEFSNFLTQIRKRSIEPGFTTQFPQFLDYQVLIQTDLFIRVDTVKFTPWGVPSVIKCYVHDYWGQWTGKDWRKPWPPQPGDEDWVITFYNMERFAGIYNSKELVAAIYSKHRDAIIAQGVAEGIWEEQADVENPSAADPGPSVGAVVAVPESFEDLLPKAGPFNLMAFLTKAKEWYPEIRNRNDFSAYLEGIGYTVLKNGAQWIGVRKQEG